MFWLLYNETYVYNECSGVHKSIVINNIKDRKNDRLMIYQEIKGRDLTQNYYKSPLQLKIKKIN